jgi:hypothetical protein
MLFSLVTVLFSPVAVLLSPVAVLFSLVAVLFSLVAVLFSGLYKFLSAAAFVRDFSLEFDKIKMATAAVMKFL